MAQPPQKLHVLLESVPSNEGPQLSQFGAVPREAQPDLLQAGSGQSSQGFEGVGEALLGGDPPRGEEPERAVAPIRPSVWRLEVLQGEPHGLDHDPILVTAPVGDLTRGEGRVGEDHVKRREGVRGDRVGDLRDGGDLAPVIVHGQHRAREAPAQPTERHGGLQLVYEAESGLLSAEGHRACSRADLLPQRAAYPYGASHRPGNAPGIAQAHAQQGGELCRDVAQRRGIGPHAPGEAESPGALAQFPGGFAGEDQHIRIAADEVPELRV